MIQELTNFGEENTSEQLRNIPLGFHFKDLTLRTGLPKLAAVKDALFASAEEFYADWEIVGQTYVDFLRGLNISLDMNADTLERVLEVYDSDASRPVEGTTYTRNDLTTYNLKNEAELLRSLAESVTAMEKGTTITDNGSIIQSGTTSADEMRTITGENSVLSSTDVTDNTKLNHTGTGSSNVTGEHVDVPVDVPENDKPATRDRSNTTESDGYEDIGLDTSVSTSASDGTSGGTDKLVGSGTSGSTETKTSSQLVTGTDTNTVTDSRTSLNESNQTGTLGVAGSNVGTVQDFKILKSFIQANMTIQEVFVSYFRDNFTLRQTLYW